MGAPRITSGRFAGWHLLLPAVLCLLGVAVQAGAREAASWRAECKLAERAFALEFTSISADPDDRDMKASLLLPGHEPLVLPLAPGIFRPRSVVANQPSACRELGAYLIHDQIHKAVPPRLLLLLSVEDRPGWDLLSLVVVDLEAGKVLHQMERLAPIKDPDGRQGLTLLIVPDHMQVRLQRQWLLNTGTDSPENSIEDWHRIELRAGRIRANWAR